MGRSVSGLSVARFLEAMMHKQEAQELLSIAKSLTADEAEARTCLVRMEEVRRDLALFSGHVEEVIRGVKRQSVSRRAFDRFNQDDNEALYDVLRQIGKARELDRKSTRL